MRKSIKHIYNEKLAKNDSKFYNCYRPSISGVIFAPLLQLSNRGYFCCSIMTQDNSPGIFRSLYLQCVQGFVLRSCVLVIKGGINPSIQLHDTSNQGAYHWNPIRGVSNRYIRERAQIHDMNINIYLIETVYFMQILPRNLMTLLVVCLTVEAGCIR